jgi:hypothetical protein
VDYPRPLTSLHQIEPSTFCSLKCRYCPSPKLPKIRGQERMHMSLETFERALEWCKHFDKAGTQGELSLTGIGETLLHPEWRTMVAMAREALPSNFINFSTNGLVLDDDACKVLREHQIAVFVSLHRPEKAGPAIEAAKRAGIYAGPNASAATSSFDWLGEVAWEVSAPPGVCAWLQQGWGNVLVDGRISTCCFDAAAKGVVGHVDDPIAQGAEVQPWSGCPSCFLTPP